MHYLSPFSSFVLSVPYGLAFIPLLIVVIVWTLVLKGYALWYAARGGQKWWFIALTIINTFGVLEIIYLIWYRPKSPVKEIPPVHTSSPA
ncbi:MAG: DUF5652 family protein [Candidatus Kaiserbacteria bacterium]|nr:DUF5652 family protein [Candidatus Kaiserbacteria bacterium]